MSHFLARLVERARGTAARVEPIVAPRFAPTAIVEIASEVETPPPRTGRSAADGGGEIVAACSFSPGSVGRER